MSRHRPPRAPEPKGPASRHRPPRTSKKEELHRYQQEREWKILMETPPGYEKGPFWT